MEWIRDPFVIKPGEFSLSVQEENQMTAVFKVLPSSVHLKLFTCVPTASLYHVFHELQVTVLLGWFEDLTPV